MLRQMEEIQGLALKYSKAQLGRMVQMGMLDPQKAMMAGMMIDRVEKQNATQAPQTTVAEDVLGTGGQLAPQGLEALPAGEVGNYAGGGIVAFDEGGEVPGFAGGVYLPPGLFDAVVQAESRGNPNAVSSKGARGLAQLMPNTARKPGYGVKPAKDDSQEENLRVGRDYLDAMMKKYNNLDYALAAYDWGPGNVDKWIKRGANPNELPRETRDYIPRVKSIHARQEAKMPQRAAAEEKMPVPDVIRRPLEALSDAFIPAAQAAEAQSSGATDRSARIAPSGPGSLVPPPKRSYSQAIEAARPDLPSLRRGAPEVGMYGIPLATQNEMMARRQVGVGYTNPITGMRVQDNQTGMPTPAEYVQSSRGLDAILAAQQTPNLDQGTPGADQTPPGVPQLPAITRPDLNIQPKTYTAPEARALGDISKERLAAYKELGINPEAINEMIAKEEGRRGELEQRKGAMKGEALFEFGAKLLGARRGKEFEAASEAATSAFSGMRQAAKELRADEEKLQDRINAFRLADQQARMTGADKDIAQREKERERVIAAENKAVDAENDFAKAKLTAGTHMYSSELAAQTQRYVADQQAKVYKEYNADLRKMGYEEAEIKNISDIAAKYLIELEKSPMNTQIDKALLEQRAMDYAIRAHRQARQAVTGGAAPAPVPGSRPPLDMFQTK